MVKKSNNQMHLIIKNIILLILLIVVILSLLLNMAYGFKHENGIVNILIFLFFIITIFFNLKIRDKNLFLMIFRIILMLISLILIGRFVMFQLVYWYAGPEKEINRYIFPSNPNESLKNVYYADNKTIFPPIGLVYEKRFALGIKCSITIASNLDDITIYDLEEEYKKIQKINNRNFCDFK